MLTSKDIDTLLGVFATKNEVREIVREELHPFQKTQQRILSAVDKLAAAIETQNLENAARDSQLSRHDKWIHKIGNKTKVSLSE